MHESRMHEVSSFVTLTYKDECIPYGDTLHYPHFQDFMKSLRHKLAPKKVRFFMCGEYGETTRRPHYHVALFGCGFQGDRYPWRMSSAGFQLYRSPLLEQLWDFGNAEIGDLSFESAAYVARYCTKKITGDKADAHYAKLVPDTGEIVQCVPEFARMSLKPGIGGDWWSKYRQDYYWRDYCIMEGRQVPLPRYYRNQMSEAELKVHESVRFEKFKNMDFDDDVDRLRVREVVARARLSFNKRSLE